ncbi:hypothetical protein N7519_006928 [Penicillium mononematosum]|uniref:uncharacterized protein n=1 Tax=Penicillium mononematosum TaxID=268346 RepID=UPI0025478FFE|nr:uncharacterized protein N7519_006928 [Penicillium mononematosum]KAJ6185627.1 hypothetical protein N7519_006928 [Penicillium mononematosum]
MTYTGGFDMAPRTNMSLMKDPQDWTVDELVTFLCHDKPGDWSYNLVCPDLVKLEASLRENSISGLSFLDITDDHVKELGIKVIAQRQYVLKACKWLQRRSTKYQLDQLEQQRPLVNEQQRSAGLNDNNSTSNHPTHPNVSSTLLPTGEKRRRVGTTIAARPSTPSLPGPLTPEGPRAPIFDDGFFERLLSAYPPDDTEVLPLLGGSGSEGEYDTETREELGEDGEQSRAGTPPDAAGGLGEAEFNKIVDQYIETRKAQFIEIRLPKEQAKGFYIWNEGQKSPGMKNEISTQLAHLEKRSQSLRKALAEAQHSSRSSLVKACACLDPTVADICLYQWKLSILEQISPPPKLARPPRTTRPEKPTVNSDGEETLSSDSDSTHGIGDMEHKSPEQSEDGLRLVSSSDISEPEEHQVVQDQEVPRSREAYQVGPFRDYSSDEDLGHLFYKDENYEPPVAKRRRLEKDILDQGSPIPPLPPITTMPLKPDIALPSKERDGGGQTGANTYPVDPMHLKTHESVDPASDNGSETDEAVLVFDDVYSMMWATIEESGNRIHLLAKALMDLRKNRLRQLLEFLVKYMPCVYPEHARDALKSMCEDSSAMEGWDPEESHCTMLMTALFVSWVNVIHVPIGAFRAKEVKAALVAVRDEEENQFAPFFKCLNDLLRGYRKWLNLPYRLQSDEMNTAIRRDKQEFTDDQMTLTPVQKEGKEREDKAFLTSRLAHGHAHLENLSKPVSFRIPMIYLDPRIAQYVKPHQLSGIRFMFREIVENRSEEGCLLAHTMGLGKTMQVISLLVTISKAGASPDPAIRDQIPKELRQSKTLILCPASLIQNWHDEFAMWPPTNHKLGNIRSIPTKNPTLDRTEEIRAWNDEGGILILSYNIFRIITKDNVGRKEDQGQQSVNESVKSLVLNSPTLVVVDEAQNLRNQGSQISEAASRLRTRKRIALTGTPISNGLEDYYWMVNWVAPRFLGSFAKFNEDFIKPIENGTQIESQNFDRRKALQCQEMFLRLIEPKVQRADMSALAVDLPPKYEFSVYFELTSLQKALYNIFVQGVGREAGVRPELMSWLPLLKLCCNHPAIFKADLESRKSKNSSGEQKGPSSDGPSGNLGSNVPVEEQIITKSILPELDDAFKEAPDLLDPSLSSRVMILNEIINQAITLGDKVLVFSGSIPTLKYLAQVMDKTQRMYALLEGSMPAGKRSEIVRGFNDDPSTYVFLISTKTGGVGLNIQTANRVVIFDFQFNPTWEQQAIGRAYRIGQKKKVFVYRMVAAGTVEEKIFSKTIFKSQLAGRLLDDEHVARMGSKAEEKYLVPWSKSAQQEGICPEALAKDPGTLERIKSSKCAQYILSIKQVDHEEDPDDVLTAEERKTVEDELELRRLRISSEEL